MSNTTNWEKRRLSVIIPAFNESGTIGQVLKSVLQQKMVSEVIVVDDGSTDDTVKVVSQTKDPKITVITHRQNLGKGAAIRSGLAKVTGTFVIIQDADLEYNPSEYQKLLQRTNDGTAVYGSRIMGNNRHAYEITYLGNVIITAFCNFLFGTHLTDAYTCYKLLPVTIAQSLDITSRGFEVEAEITAKLAKQGITIVEVPISYNPRTYEEGKKIKTKDALIGALTLLKIRFS